jgi:hypothetical protein
VKNVSLQQFFEEIETKSPYRFSYRDVVLENKKDVTLHVTNQSIESVQDKILPSHGLQYAVNGVPVMITGKAQLDLTPLKSLTLTAIFAPRFPFTKGKKFSRAAPVYCENGSMTCMQAHKTTSLSETRDDSNSRTYRFCGNWQNSRGDHSFRSIGIPAGELEFPLADWNSGWLNWNSRWRIGIPAGWNKWSPTTPWPVMKGIPASGKTRELRVQTICSTRIPVSTSARRITGIIRDRPDTTRMNRSSDG